jgi:hypothetical protein
MAAPVFAPSSYCTIRYKGLLPMREAGPPVPGLFNWDSPSGVQAAEIQFALVSRQLRPNLRVRET